MIATMAIGCGQPSRQIVIGPPDSPAALPETHGSPHGSDIAALAVTEAADCALTADQGGRLRLWPALDGSREPVVLDSPPAHAVALGIHDDELVAATIDTVGSVRVLRLSRDGRVLAQASVAGDVPARQIVAFGADILIRRIDQSIERVDASGIARGRIAARPGERLGAIAVRSGAAVVAIVNGDRGESTTLRWLDLGERLAWGRDLDMPQTIDPELVALSPSRTRIAAGHPRPGREPELAVYEVVKSDVQTFAMPDIDIANGNAIGFASDHKLAVAGERAPAWWTDSSTTPDTKPEGDELLKRARASGPGAVGDGLAVYAYGAGLALATPKKTRYLGWRDLVLQNPGDGLTYGLSEGRFLWLDRELHVTHRFDTHIENAYQAFPLDEHRLIVMSRHETNTRLSLVDVRDPDKPFTVYESPAFAGWSYEPVSRVFAISESDAIHRFQVAADRLAASELPKLVHSQVYELKVLDPAKADGASLLLVEYDGETEGQRIDLVRGTHHERQTIEGAVLAIDATGVVYTRVVQDIVAYRGRHKLRTFPSGSPNGTGAVSHDGKSLALTRPHEIAMLDSEGHERWHRELWTPMALTFSDADDELFVRTQTGLVAYNAATGEPITRTCGFEFGLQDSVYAMTYGQSTVCEDDAL